MIFAEGGAPSAYIPDVDIAEAGEGWGDDDIVLDEGNVLLVHYYSTLNTFQLFTFH